MTRQLATRLAALLVALIVAAPAFAQAGGARPAAGQAAQAPKTPPPAAKPPAAQPAKPVAPAKPAASSPQGLGPAPRPPAKPSTPPARPEATARPSAQEPETPAPGGYSYRPEGRRDPFVSLFSPGTGTRQRSRVEGIAGIYTIDLIVKGILQSEGRFVAIVLGSDGKRQYILHTNDRLADGVVKAITADSVLILQEVSDPLSLARQREVRKTLRAVEEVK